MIARPASRRGRPTGPSLRAAMLVVAAIALVCYGIGERPHRRRVAADAVRALGGFATLDDQHDPMRPAAAPPAALTPAWLGDQLGPEFGHEVTLVHLDGRPVQDEDLAVIGRLPALRRLHLNGTPITDDGLAHLAPLRTLERLELRETIIGDAGLAHLRGLDRLEELYLYGTPITDDGLRSLAGLRSLRVLSLRRTAIGDGGLRHLRGLTELRELHLEDTNVTGEGASELAASLPQVVIYR